MENWLVHFFQRHREDDPAAAIPRRHYRLFCILERDGAALGLGGPSIVLVTGMDKPFRTTFTVRDYQHVRRLGEEYRRRVPRSVAR